MSQTQRPILIHNCGKWRVEIWYNRKSRKEKKRIWTSWFTSRHEAAIEGKFMQTVLEGFGLPKWIKCQKMTHSERQSIVMTAKYQNCSRLLKSKETITQMATIDNIENLTDLELSRCLRERCGWTMTRIAPKRCWFTHRCGGIVQWFPAPNSYTTNLAALSQVHGIIFGSLSCVRKDILSGSLTLCETEHQTVETY